MEVLILLIFIGLALVSAAFVAFAWSVRSGSLDHSDRLTLLPLEGDITERQRNGTKGERERRHHAD